MTMARDESVMLPRWVRYYGEQVGYHNLLVLDDQTVDGSTTDLPCPVIRLPQLPGGKWYEPTRMDLASGLAAGLLVVHDFVVFVDADEFLIPDPARYDGLLPFLAARADHPVVAGTALNVMHLVDLEPPLRSDEPLLGQRRFGKYVPIMCKPSIKRIPAAWYHSSHGIMAPFEPDPDLFMIHLKFADRDTMVGTAARRNAVIDVDGRAEKSSWRLSPEDLDRLLAEWAAGYNPDGVPEFDPHSVNLSAVVAQRQMGSYKARGGQLGAMKKQPLVRVPERLYGRV